MPDLEFIILWRALNTDDGGIDAGYEIFQCALFKSLFDEFWIENQFCMKNFILFLNEIFSIISWTLFYQALNNDR